MKMEVKINDMTFLATLEQNQAADELVALLRQGSMTLLLQDHGGFEKVGELGHRLSTHDKYITTNTGDIVLYQGNQIVLFYGSNSWSYTRLGHIDDLTGWNEALGTGSIQIVLSLAK